MRLELVSFVPPAAEPAVPSDDEVPFFPVDVPPRPSVEADVPPTLAVPPLPPVALVLDGVLEEPPDPTLDALCAKAIDPAPAASTDANKIVFKLYIVVAL
jgi:hypothetical protein